MRRKIVIAAAAGVLALAAGLVLLFARCGNLGPAPRYAVVYEKGSQNLYAALPEGCFPLRAQESSRQVFAGQYLYYDAVTDAGTDIYVMNLRNSRSRKEGGKAIAQGVRGAWTVSADGRCAAWVETGGSVLRRYDAQRDSMEELASGVDALYAAPGQDACFFTKAQDELFRCNLKLGQRPERMAGEVRDVRLFSGLVQGRQRTLVYYLQPAGDIHDLYALSQEGGAVLVAQAPATVLFDSYELGGNLYFLKRGQGIAVPVAIDDPQAESDAAMAQPQRPAIGSGLLGGLFSDILGGGGPLYQREKAAWDRKIERDAVRAAVEEALEGMPEGEIPMDCYVYDGAGARLLARGVREDHIALLRAQGRPAMLYGKQSGEPTAADGEAPGMAVSLDTLVASYRADGVDAVRETLYDLAGGGAETTGYALAMMAPDGPSEVPLGPEFGGKAGWKALFLPGGETVLYQERDVEGGLYALYSYEMTDYGLTERKIVGLDADDMVPAAGGVYFSKKEADAKGSALYYCAADGQTGRVLRGVGAFFPAGNFLLALDDAGTLHCVSGTASRRLDSGVRLEGIHAGGPRVCYLAQWEAGAGILRLSDLKAKGSAAAKTLDVGVTAIRAVAG